MENINFIFPEIFISLSVMFLLVFGVFKKNSSNIVYSLTVISLIVALALIINLPANYETFLFDNSYKIDVSTSTGNYPVFVGWDIFDQILE